MAARPGLIDQEQLAALPDNPVELITEIKAGARNFLEAGATEAYCGFPKDATVAEGDASYQRLVEIVTEVVKELLDQKQS